MTTRIQLGIGETGYIRLDQLWLDRSIRGEMRLFAEPPFLAPSHATNDMLHVTGMENSWNNLPRIAVGLPSTEQMHRLQHPISTQEAQARGFVRVTTIFAMTPGQEPFRTVPVFFFK